MLLHQAFSQNDLLGHVWYSKFQFSVSALLINLLVPIFISRTYGHFPMYGLLVRPPFTSETDEVMHVM